MATELKPIKTAKLPLSLDNIGVLFDQRYPITEKLFNKLSGSKYDLYRREGIPVTFQKTEDEYALVQLTFEACQAIGLPYFDPDEKFRDEILAIAGYTVTSNEAQDTWWCMLPGETLRDEGKANFLGDYASRAELLAEAYSQVELGILENNAITIADWAVRTQEEKFADANGLRETILSMSMAQEIFSSAQMVKDVATPDDVVDTPAVAPKAVRKVEAPSGKPDYAKHAFIALQHVTEVIESGGSIEEIDLEFIKKTVAMAPQPKKSAKQGQGSNQGQGKSLKF